MLFLRQAVHHHYSVTLVLNSKREQAISNSSFVRILVVDDFAPWRRFLIAKLRENHNLRIVGVASDGLEAVLKAEELQPDLILMDIGLPKLNGIEAARRIRKITPKSKILFLSQELDLEVTRAALAEGGHGYVVKSDADNELFAAVEAVMLGNRFVSHRLTGPASANAADSQTGDPPRSEDAIAAPVAPFSLRRELARCHEVQFYSEDSLFLDAFTRFIGTALKSGSATVFIGTASHRISLLERLHAESPDARAAIRQGRYIGLDAVEFLSNFMVDDMPDASWFLKVVGDLIAAAAEGANGEHLRVAACGECAPFLWAEGKADAAIRLEELWNEIAKTYDVDILCGYLLESLRCDEDSYTFRRICEEHSAFRSG
jgi:DNA-binding NarL/FixJ family response regulator